MNKDLDAKLCSDFPILFRDRNEDMTKTCMCWGFECGDGWEPIIRDLCRVIDNHIYNENNHLKYKTKLQDTEFTPIECHIDQIKEKFGILRFYVDYEDDYIYGAISMAENVSSRTCEVCGKEGKLNDDGWLSVKCDEHRKPQKGVWND